MSRRSPACLRRRPGFVLSQLGVRGAPSITRASAAPRLPPPRRMPAGPAGRRATLVIPLPLCGFMLRARLEAIAMVRGCAPETRKISIGTGAHELGVINSIAQSSLSSPGRFTDSSTR